MKSHYICGKCKLLLEANEEFFFPHSLKKVSSNANLTVIGQCKSCANQYATQWRASIKEKGLVRSQRTTLALAGAVVGTVYVQGPDIPGLPYKIGVTAGRDTRKRLSGNQVGNWHVLKEVWKSDLLDRADLIEDKLHKHFESKRVRGEWFDITRQDIDAIPSLIEQFGVEE
jgi:Meiotically up-regulated gene 113